MAMTAQTRNNVKPNFITVVRPNSNGIGGDETKVDKFERLFDKWKRRQDYRRKIDRQTRKNKISDPTISSRSKSKSDVDSLEVEDNKLEPFDFQNPPKVLQIRPVTLVSKPPEKRKKRTLPKLVVKETVASKARSKTSESTPEDTFKWRLPRRNRSTSSVRLVPIRSENNVSNKKKKTSNIAAKNSTTNSKVETKKPEVIKSKEPEIEFKAGSRKPEQENIAKDDIDEGFASNRSNSSSASPEETKRKKVPKLIVSEISEKERIELEAFSEEAVKKQAKDVAKSTLILVLEELNEEEGVNIELFSV